MMREFKSFILRGNVIDLAVGVIVGAAFSKIVSSFIEDVITPLILKPALDRARLTRLQDLTVFGTVKYGNFLAALINFLLVSFILFLFIKAANAVQKRWQDEKPPAPVAPPAEIQLLTEIRDLLKK